MNCRSEPDKMHARFQKLESDAQYAIFISPFAAQYPTHIALTTASMNSCPLAGSKNVIAE